MIMMMDHDGYDHDHWWLMIDGGDDQEEEDEEGVRNGMVILNDFDLFLNDRCAWNGKFYLT